MYKLPSYLRPELQKPWGKLIKTRELAKLINNPKYILTVGDIATHLFKQKDIPINLAVVDYRTKRGKVNPKLIKEFKELGDRKLRVKNPPGLISDSLLAALSTALKEIDHNSTLIEVIGEEDLAALPIFKDAPDQSLVAYGMPSNGLVLVKINRSIREKAMNVLKLMKEGKNKK
jgi:hypothetical protein